MEVLAREDSYLLAWKDNGLPSFGIEWHKRH